MTDTSAWGRIEFHILWCRDCVSLIRSRFRDQVFDQISTSGHVWFRSTKKLWQKTKTQIITYSTNPKKFSFHHSSTKFPFNRVSNQNWFLGHDHARLTRLVLRRQFVAELIAFASTSLGAAKVRAPAISILLGLLIKNKKIKRED